MLIVEPDPLWPARYAAEAVRLHLALGPALLAMEHVGSTAIPGLAAKPVIDVMAAVEALSEVETRLPALAALAYALVPTDMADRLLLQRAAMNEAPEFDLAVNLHVVTLASWPSRKERLFRDRLLAHSEEAAAYSVLKRELIGRHEDLAAYTRAKTELIQEIMDRVADEAGRPRASVWEE